ncbi:MAG TPA: ATPase, T2SS/T4P/T4SS family [Ideonella sp.]|nr:ATPase, T2SS/T4P/T4SS family [Ideonella sp.]
MLSPMNWELAPREEAVAADDKPAQPAFAWPTPPYAAYPPAEEQHVPLACEIEGLNGRLMRGRMIFFVPEEQVVHVQVPPARVTMPLRFDQFRRLALVEPLAPDADVESGPQRDAPADQLLAQRPQSPYEIVWVEGEPTQGRTIGHVLADFGLFLFEPLDADDRVRRVFVPRPAYRSFEAGSTLGELLVDSRIATLDQIEQAEHERERLRGRRLGDILLNQQVLTHEALHAALEEQSRMPMVRIGEALISLGLIDEAQLDAALAQQARDRGVPLGEILVRNGVVSPRDLQSALARKMGYPVVDVAQFPCDVAAVRRIPYALARRHKALPLMLREGRLVVALEDATQPQLIDELEFAAQMKIVPALAPLGSVEPMLRAAYERAGANVSAQLGAASAESGEFEPADTSKLVESLEREGADRIRLDDDKPIEQSDNSLVRLINNMIVEAWSQGVSDIHVESHAGREKVKIRFRKDGVLQPYLELPHNYRNAMIARIKIMCDLDISERRKPQDGKINFARFSPSHRVELRVATVPTHSGLEDVVMRLLASAKPIPMGKLGLNPSIEQRLRQAAERPYGLILCVGPTGSGKTTTLHSLLSHINVPERKIWTAEDPIEITQPGLRQVQVNPKIDWTFAKALRAFLRADPDVIMVGEMRDRETAQTAIEASLTGHLVLSTLHTNSAADTVTRLLDMGMDPFNFGDSLLVVLAQRLVRALCPHCRRARAANATELDELLGDYLNAFPDGAARPAREPLLRDLTGRFGRKGRLLLHESPGCVKCGQTGLAGRTAVHELMVMSRGLRRLIQTGARSEELARLAADEGLRTLRQDGIDKVLAGVTTIEEVRAMSNV